MNPNITELHANSMQNFDRIKQLLAEADESGVRTLEQLSIDREKLLKINKNVDDVNSKVSISKRIISKMKWEDNKKNNYQTYCRRSCNSCNSCCNYFCSFDKKIILVKFIIKI